MKKRKKMLVTIGVACISACVVIPGVIGYSFEKSGMDFRKWGNVLNEESKRDIQQAENSNSVNKDIVFQGENAAVTKEKLKKAEAFYRLSGDDEARAAQQAAEYCKEHEALYSEALRQGFHTNEKEIQKTADELKENFHSEDISEESKKEYEEIIAQFDSEDAYWDYEKIILKKDIPIRKLADKVEAEYHKNHPEDDGSGFSGLYESYKKELVQKEKYRSPDNMSDRH